MFQAHGVRICLHSTLRTYPGETISRYGYLPASLRSLPNTSSGHRLNPDTNPKAGHPNLACLVSRASARTLFRRYQNINWLSIDYACRPRLRSRLTQGRLA